MSLFDRLLGVVGGGKTSVPQHGRSLSATTPLPTAAQLAPSSSAGLPPAHSFSQNRLDSAPDAPVHVYERLQSVPEQPSFDDTSPSLLTSPPLVAAASSQPAATPSQSSLAATAPLSALQASLASMGHKRLCELLLRSEAADQPSREVSAALMDIMVDGCFRLDGATILSGDGQADGEADDDSETRGGLTSPSLSATSLSAPLSMRSSASTSTIGSPASTSPTLAPLQSPAACPPTSAGFSFSPSARPVSPPLVSVSRVPDRYIISRPDVMCILFSRQRFLRCTRSHQSALLLVFCRLMSACSLNAAMAAKVSLIDLLLDLFPYFPPLVAHETEKDSLQCQSIALIRQCGLHSITVRQLKRFIGLLRTQSLSMATDRLSAYSSLASSRVVSPSLRPQSSPVSLISSSSSSSSSSSGLPSAIPSPRQSPTDGGVTVSVRPFYTVAVLEALEEMSAKEGPDNFFCFDGIRGGLALPQLPAFPSRGWSVSCWLRMESFSAPPPSASQLQRRQLGTDEVSPASFIPPSVLQRLSPIHRPLPSATHRGSSSQPSTPAMPATLSPHMLPSLSPSSSRHPRLLHLMSSSASGGGLDIYFTDRRLTISVVSTRSTAQSLLIENSQLREKQWYHLAITQSPPPTFGHSTLTLYINGHATHTSTTLRYPTSNKPLDRCFIGTDGGGTEPAADGRPQRPSQCLHGQMGPCYILDEAISATHVQAMYALGPSHLYTASIDGQLDAELVEAEQRMAEADSLRSPSDGTQAVGGKAEQRDELPLTASQRRRSAHMAQSVASLAVARHISNRIVLAYNAKARHGRIHLNIAPRVQDEVEQFHSPRPLGTSAAAASPVHSRGMHAMALKGTHRAVTRHVLDSLSCLNGLATLFPCFKQLDLPVQRCTPVSEAEKARRRRVKQDAARWEEKQRQQLDEQHRREQEEARERRRQLAIEAKLLALQQYEAEGGVRSIAEGVNRLSSISDKDERGNTDSDDVCSEPEDDDEREDEDEGEEDEAEEEDDDDEGERNEVEGEHHAVKATEGHSARGGEEGLDEFEDGGEGDGEEGETVGDEDEDEDDESEHDAVESEGEDAVLDFAAVTLATPSASPQPVQSNGDESHGHAIPTTAAKAGAHSSIHLTQASRFTFSMNTPKSTTTSSPPSISASFTPSYAPSPQYSPSPSHSVLYTLPPVPMPDLAIDYDVDLVYDVDSRLLLHLLRCLLAVLSDSPLHQAYMQRYRGFHLIAHQLEHASPRHLSVKVLLCLDKLLVSSRQYPRLYRAAFFALLCNMRLWLYVPPIVQRSWLRMLCSVVMRDPWLLRHAAGSQRVLDQLRSVCWFESEGDSMALRHQLLHPVTHNVIGVRPYHGNLHTLRSELLQILNLAITAPGSASITEPVQLQSSIAPVTLYVPQNDDEDEDDSADTTAAALSPTDVRAVVLSLQSLVDEEQKVELLQLLSQWLHGDDSAMVLRTLAEMDCPDVALPLDLTSRIRQREDDGQSRSGIDIFLATLASPSSAARVTSLRCIHKLLRSGIKLSEGALFVAILNILRAEEDSRQDREEREREQRRHQQREQRDEGVNGTDMPRILALQKNASHGVLDQPLYLALLSLMLGDVVDESNVEEMRHNQWLDEPVILHVTVLQILFSLIAMQTSVKRNRVRPRRLRAASTSAQDESSDEDDDSETTADMSLSQADGLTSDDLLVSVMQDIQLLLQSDNNRTLVLEQWSWPSWLFALMCEPRQHRKDAVTAGKRAHAASITHPTDSATLSATQPSAAVPPSLSTFSFVTTASGTLFSYALSMFETLLFFALHKQSGWKSYERCLAWLAMYSYDSRPSALPHFPPSSTPCYHPLPVLQILRAVLQSMHRTLRKEAEVRARSTEEMSVLMDNIAHVRETTEHFLLHRLTAYSELLATCAPQPLAASPAASPAIHLTPAGSPPILSPPGVPVRSESAGSRLTVEQKASSPQPSLPTVLSSPGLAPSADGWEWADMQLLLEQEMTAVFPIVELLLGVEAWLFLMRREAVEEEEMRIATAAAEAQHHLTHHSRKWSLFGHDTAATTPSTKAPSRKTSTAALPPSAFTAMRESEQLSLMNVLVRVVQCCSTSTALFALLFASARADELTGIMGETFNPNPASMTGVSEVLARYSTPGRVRLNAAGRWSSSPSSATHRRSSSAVAFSYATLLPASATPLSSVGSMPNSPGSSKRSQQSDVSSSLCTLVYALAANLPLWDQLDCSPVFSSFFSATPPPVSRPADTTRSPSRLNPPAALRFPPASPPELSSLRYLGGDEDSSLTVRSLSSPSAIVPPLPPHPLQEQNGYVAGGCRVSLLSVLSLLSALLQLMRDRCPTATFLIATAATLRPSGSEGALAPSPSPQPSSGALSATSSSGPSPPSTPVRSSPSSQQSSVGRASKRRDSLTTTDEERVKEHRRIKEIGRSFGLEAATTNSALSNSPTTSSTQAVASLLRPFSPAQLRSSPFSSFLASKASPSRSPTLSAPRKPASLRVMTDSGVAHQLSYASVTFTLPDELKAVLNTLPQTRLTEAQCATLASFMLHSAAWSQSVQPLKLIAAHFVQTEATAVRRQMDSFARSAAYLLDLHSTVQQTETQQYSITAMYVEAVRTQHAQIEMERRQLVRRRADKKRRGEQQTWRLILRQLTNERGAWSNAPHCTAEFWKLDETETASRMRMKLKVNTQGTRHLEAANSEHDTTERNKKRNGEDGTVMRLPAALSGVVGAEELLKMALQFSRSQSGAIAPERQKRRRPGDISSDDEQEEFDTLSEAVEAHDKADQQQAGNAAPTRTTVYSKPCWMIHPTERSAGQLTLTATSLRFEAKEEEAEPKRRTRRRLSHVEEDAPQRTNRGRDYVWPLSSITAVHYRRHQLQRNSLELFFSSHHCVFIKLHNQHDRDKVHRKLVKAIRKQRAGSPHIDAIAQSYQRPHVQPQLPFLYSAARGGLFGGPWGGSPVDVLKHSGLTLAWQRRQLSNFDYLMHLNTIAGRTFNDLAQYPIFPWILADYNSPTLDLHDETKWATTYRDLTKPVGALNPQRLQNFLDRFHGMDRNDPTLPPFLYGSSYSNSGFVLFYLMRVEPFATAAIQLQDGRFDHADRLFSSIAGCWHGVTTGPADVKELIPEWFYLPEMLRNENKLPLGKSQAGINIDDVELPPWAGGSAEQFVRIHREALESEYVSQHLHHWIDLIFGYKQRGNEAELAHNLFFHLIYDGAVDLDQLDPIQRPATIAQIEHFGQISEQVSHINKHSCLTLVQRRIGPK